MTAGALSFTAASATTAPGDYAVDVTRAATQAQATVAGTLAAGQTITLSTGTASTSYTVAGGDDLAAVARGLNLAFAGNSVHLVASAETDHLLIKSVDYGSTPTFTAIADGGLIASATNWNLTGTVAAGQDVNVTVGATTVSYTTTGSDNLASLSSQLNALFTSNSLALTAVLDSGKIVLQANDGTTTFTASSTNGLTVGGVTPGVDVAGTIDGKAATGTGQVLTATGAGGAKGLSVRIAATAADIAASTAVGTLVYRPGLAQRLNTVSTSAVDIVSGSLTSAIQGRQQEMTDLDTQIADWDNRLALRETELKRQFTAMETALGQLRDQSNWLAGQISSLPTYNG